MKTITIADLKNIINEIPDETPVVIGWQFRDAVSAKLKTINYNGEPKTGFQLVDDFDDLID